MKSVSFFIFLLAFQLAMSQTIFGKWKTVDNFGVEKCIVNIYKKNNKIYGEIIQILVKTYKNAICAKCKGEDKNKPVLGLTLIKDMNKDGKYYRNGTIFDPEHGETFKCRITLENDSTLQVRGYLSFLYATQYWKRVD